MSEIDKQSIRADQYEETTKYAPDWPPKPKQSVDPSVHTTCLLYTSDAAAE